MSEIILHTANLPKSYSRKNDDFLGALGVVYNYILLLIIYIIFFSTDIPFDSFFYVIM